MSLGGTPFDFFFWRPHVLGYYSWLQLQRRSNMLQWHSGGCYWTITTISLGIPKRWENVHLLSWEPPTFITPIIPTYFSGFPTVCHAHDTYFSGFPTVCHAHQMYVCSNRTSPRICKKFGKPSSIHWFLFFIFYKFYFSCFSYFYFILFFHFLLLLYKGSLPVGGLSLSLSPSLNWWCSAVSCSILALEACN